MKKLYPLLSVLFISTSIVVGQQSTIPQYTIGFGGGSGKGGPNVNFGMTMKIKENYKYFMTFGSNGILNSQNESNTYTFNENLLDDETRGILESYSWITLGYVLQFKSVDFHLGGGWSGYDKYYEKYDPSEILSGTGTYYVYDEESGDFTFTPSVGFTVNSGNEKSESPSVFKFKGVGFSLITIPVQYSLMIWFGF
jgi:hypothetical protein